MSISTIDLIHASPTAPALDATQVAATLDACLECSRACLQCADACLAEASVPDLVACIRLNSDCADICGTTARLLARQVAVDPALLQVVLQTCVAATKLCGDECESHAPRHRHCELCAQVCRRCEEACRSLLGALV